MTDSDEVSALPANGKRTWMATWWPALVVAVVLALIGTAVGLYVTRSSANAVKQTTASPVPPPPTGAELARLIPSGYDVKSEGSITLSGSSRPFTVVTDAETQAPSSGLLAADLLLLGWDGFTKRWDVVWDGAQAQGPGIISSGEPLSQSAILPSAADIGDLHYSAITPTPGHTDLAFSAGESFGANGQLAFGIVGYDGQNASLLYDDVVELGASQVAAAASVHGRAPHQALAVHAPYLTDVDALCCAVRAYDQMVSYAPSSTGQPYWHVTSDSRTWLGIYAEIDPGTTSVAPTSPLIVNAVADGSPASSVIQRGDEILSVEGVTPPNASNLLGPSIIDAVASQLPGTPLALLIKRDGQQMVVHMTASSYENPARANTSTPEAGYLGIEMTTDSPAVSQSDGLGTDRGAVIVSTPSNSPAANAGLVSGDVITSINGTQVSGTTDVSLALASVTAADSVSIDYVDLNGASHTVNVQLSSYPQSNSTFPPTVYAL